MLYGCIDCAGLSFNVHMHDVEELNKLAFSHALDVTKLSVYAYFKLKDSYEILDSGAALGYGCGPILVKRSKGIFSPEAKIAIPGELTTAYLLLQLWNPDIKNIEATRFDNILEGVKKGLYDAGLIIHEGRFVYSEYGCSEVVDLGQWWETETGLPIPLGCIAIRKDPRILQHKNKVETILKGSIHYAFTNREASRQFIKLHAQEMEDRVIDAHIDLYVNDFTMSLGDTGRKALKTLEEIARWKKIL